MGSAATDERPDTRLRVLLVLRRRDPVLGGSALQGLLTDNPRLVTTVLALENSGTATSAPPVEALPDGSAPLHMLRRVRRLMTVLRECRADVVVTEGCYVTAAVLPAVALSGHRVVEVQREEVKGGAGRLLRRVGVTATVELPGSVSVTRTDSTASVTHDEELDVNAVQSARSAPLVGAIAAAVGRPGAGLDPSDGPDMSVVVPVWREGALVDELVGALLPQLRAGDELVLVDDASPDDTPDRVRRAAAQSAQVNAVCRAVNGRAGAARNSGLAQARSDHLAFTDAGCHWAPGWLDALRVAFLEDPPPDLVTGAYVVSRCNVFEAASAVGCYPDVRDVARSNAWTTVWSRLFGRRFDPTRPAGRSVAVTRQAIDLAGGWPEGLIAHEDIDLARGIAERGLDCRLTTESPIVWDQGSVADTLRMYVRYGLGDALAADRQALFRDLARAAAYLVGPLGLLKGRTGVRVLLLALSGLYVSVPVARARNEQRPLATACLVPAVVAGKDLAKAWGAVRGLRQAYRGAGRAT